VLCTTVGSNTDMPFAMATVSEAVTSESREKLATQALSEPFRCLPAPMVREEPIIYKVTNGKQERATRSLLHLAILKDLQ
jgi:hypothetical protein